VKIIKPMMGLGEPRSDKIEEAFTSLRRFCAVLDQRLVAKEYLVGGALTLADLTIASSLMYANRTDVPLTEFPNVRAWFSRISAMDAWKLTDPS
jgi:glutathione S-transferase